MFKRNWHNIVLMGLVTLLVGAGTYTQVAKVTPARQAGDYAEAGYYLLVSCIPIVGVLFLTLMAPLVQILENQNKKREK